MKKFFCLVGCVMLIVIGCGKGERASIIGSVYFHWDWYNPDSLVKSGSISGYKYDGFKIIPVMTINEDTLPLDYVYFSPTEFGYEGEITWINIGDECRFKVNYDEGKGEATGTMPGNFKITSPDTTYVLHKGSKLNINWSSAKSADWYWVNIEISYSYIDTAGDYEYFDLYVDTVVDGTSLTISANRIFPGDVDTVLWGYGDVLAEAVNGPKLEPGAKGNIKGDAVGFFWCVFDARSVYFGIEQFATRPKKDRSAEIRKKHYEAMREFALRNQ